MADFTRAELLRSVLAVNALTETRFAVVNNYIVAAIKAIFDVSQIIMAISSTQYTDLILEGMATPGKRQQEFQDMMALVNGALHREAMVNKQPLNWVSDDTLRRITGELGNISDAGQTPYLTIYYPGSGGG